MDQTFHTQNNVSSYPSFSSRTVGASTEAASTSDAAIDRGLTRLRASSQESGASSGQDLPSTSDSAQKSRSVEKDEEEGEGSGIDDHDIVENGSMDGTSDHEARENGHIDEISDHDAKENGGLDEMNLPELNKGGGISMDVVKKNRKTKKDLEVNLV